MAENKLFHVSPEGCRFGRIRDDGFFFTIVVSLYYVGYSHLDVFHLFAGREFQGLDFILQPSYVPIQLECKKQ